MGGYIAICIEDRDCIKKEKKVKDYNTLLTELLKLPTETGWLEFKKSNENPQEIGEYISALSNSAALDEKTYAYMVWGIDDTTHEIVGTPFNPERTKKGNEELESWLLRLLQPKIDFRFISIPVKGLSVILLEIKTNFKHPVKFSGVEYIRVGSNKKKLSEFPEKERELWRIFDRIPFEKEIAKESLDLTTVQQLIDVNKYYQLLELPGTSNGEEIIKRLQTDDLICINADGRIDIRNLGAIAFARSLDSFPLLKRKAVRVVIYKDNTRIETLREVTGDKGYASGFEGLVNFINNKIPKNEIMGKALRKEVPMYPELAIRELVANAIIHQDFSITGTGPMIEIFSDRLEITNPGVPIVDPKRFLDTPPRSRNEALASLMRRMGICEERGSGFDKVVFQTERFQLPPPKIEVSELHTKVILFAYKKFTAMDREEKIYATYLHSCLKYVNREAMTNQSLRERFGIEDKNSAQASRIINDTIEEGLLKRENPEGSKKYSKYVPFWA